jgi:hypothetical protein
MIELLLPCEFNTLKYCWVKATIGIYTLIDYYVAKKRQHRPTSGVWMASLHLDGIVTEWYCDLECDVGLLTWTRFSAFVNMRCQEEAIYDGRGGVMVEDGYSEIIDINKNTL